MAKTPRMQIMTCPFTGGEICVTTDGFGNVSLKNPLTGEDLTMRYDAERDAYIIPRRFFTHRVTVSFAETSEILGVSRQRVSAIAQSGVIEPRSANGSTVFLLADVLNYKETRKPGNPHRKRAEKCAESI